MWARSLKWRGLPLTSSPAAGTMLVFKHDFHFNLSSTPVKCHDSMFQACDAIVPTKICPDINLAKSSKLRLCWFALQKLH